MILQLAHSTGSGGNFEQIALAAGLILLGLAFLVQKSLDRRVSIALVVLGLVAFIGSFTFLKNVGGGETIVVQGQEFTEEELIDSITALCTAREAAESDPEEAERLFLDRTHIPMHVIAAAVEDDDRAQAARVLEAKTAVEEAFFEDPVDGEELARELTNLVEAASEALNTMGVPASTC